MARSRRKNPCYSHTSRGFNRGEKKDKQIAHRRMRSRVTQICSSLRGEINEIALDNVIFPLQRELSDIWNFAKDGKFHDWFLLQSVKYLTGHELEQRMNAYKCLRK